jgi:hypothetical protein
LVGEPSRAFLVPAFSGLDLAEPVMYLSWTRRKPVLETRRIARPQGPLAAAVSEVPGRLRTEAQVVVI